MLQWLAELQGSIPAFNVFRYITFRTGGAIITALLFVFMCGPAIIALLRLKQGKGQPIRSDGPQSHLLTKKGTPTMGGLMIFSGLMVATLLWGNLSNMYVWVVLFVTIGFGLIGFYDDYLKVTKQTHNGLSGRARLAIEAVIAGIAVVVIMNVGRAPLSSSLAFPLFKDLLIDLSYFFVIFGAFVIVAAGNAVNLTDGLDGLAIVPVMVAAGSFGMISYLSGNVLFADYLQIHYVAGAGELAVICGAIIGAGIGFLWFNAPPAQDLHGRHGFARARCGGIGAIAVATKHEIVLVHHRGPLRAGEPVGDRCRWSRSS
jgi:phospho-N-acetylmuramoyl-pentapeptide-transferase